MSGAHPQADRAGGLRPEPAAQSQPKALIPCACGASLNRLVNLASKVTALTLDEINGRDRARRFVRARMAVAHFACEAGFSASQIGGAIGGRDTSTIFNLRDKAKIWRGRDPLFDRIMDSLQDAIDRGLTEREVLPFVVPEKPVKPPVQRIDHIERADWEQARAMRRGSERLLEAMRAAA